MNADQVMQCAIRTWWRVIGWTVAAGLALAGVAIWGMH